MIPILAIQMMIIVAHARAHFLPAAGVADPTDGMTDTPIHAPTVEVDQGHTQGHVADHHTGVGQGPDQGVPITDDS